MNVLMRILNSQIASLAINSKRDTLNNSSFKINLNSQNNDGYPRYDSFLNP